MNIRIIVQYDDKTGRGSSFNLNVDIQNGKDQSKIIERIFDSAKFTVLTTLNNEIEEEIDEEEIKRVKKEWR